MATNEVIILSMSDTNYVGSLVIRRNDLDTPSKRFKCVKKDGTPFDFTDYTPVFEVRTPVGKIIRDYNSETHKAFTSEDVEDGSFTYTFSNALFNEVGDYQLAYFVFEKWDNARESMLNRKSTQNFSFKVVEDAYGGSPTPSDSLADWLQLLEQYQVWRKQLEDVVFDDKDSILAELDLLLTKERELQIKFDNIDPDKLALKDDLTSHVDDLSIHVTVDDKAGWTAKETPSGAQEKATKALNDSKNYTDSFYTDSVVFDGAVYLTEGQSYSWDISKLKKGVYIETSRYNPGTGAYDYGFEEIFYSKSFIENHVGRAVWRDMPGSSENARKEFKFTTTSVTGYAANSITPNNYYAIRKIRVV
ncbi:BppU family phage baseplate upper protein [Listeria monocytogenes]|nr:BppU family phage baseplate upper protein [Listeria monocytogenes]EIZ2814112.1 BppU family phage baseplate upper protein [Listeria monocytogenes]EIZ2817000.1 BppU family phage baseplate upper protein [Listeria monocytogenes]EJH5250430.1 BppU family phage baseplate upper protein [Listeria monocytogenes]MCW41947.1 DUF2479 domain-containing protein [Listeria monocytogenes]